MFSGIISHCLEADETELTSGKEMKLRFKSKNISEHSNVGDSIACNGVCLTISELFEDSITFYVSGETLLRSNLNNKVDFKKYNLERSLKVGDSLHGHFVTGHVDDTVQLVKIYESGKSHIFVFSMPEEYRRYIVEKGSITLNGVSLTVNNVAQDNFAVNIIPHTYENSNFKFLTKGSKVNLEIDMVSRYLANFLND